VAPSINNASSAAISDKNFIDWSFLINRRGSCGAPEGIRTPAPQIRSNA
jgi:hypothetical protein